MVQHCCDCNVPKEVLNLQSLGNDSSVPLMKHHWIDLEVIYQTQEQPPSRSDFLCFDNPG